MPSKIYLSFSSGGGCKSTKNTDLFDLLVRCLWGRRKWGWSHSKVSKMNSPSVNTFDSLGLASTVWQTSFNDGDCNPQDGSYISPTQCIAMQCKTGRSREALIQPWATSYVLTVFLSMCTFQASRRRENSLTGLKWTNTPALLPTGPLSTQIDIILYK